MSTVVTQDSTDITWNNSPYTWDSVPSNFTWTDCVLTGIFITTDYSFDLSDSFTKVNRRNRTFTENLSVSDSYSKSVAKSFTEQLSLTCANVKNPYAVIYDVTVRNAGSSDLSTLQGLARQFQNVGYEAGVEFLPGDYDFKEAIVGLVLTNNTDKVIGFKEIDVYTDTPDIVDRGTIEITNTGSAYDPTDGFTTVMLNKPYHTVPNVTATVVSGNDLAEPIFDPNGFTNVSFRIKLVLATGGSSVTGTKVVLGGTSTTETTGTLYWKAVGY